MILIMAFAASKDYENKIIVCELCYINIPPLALKKKRLLVIIYTYMYMKGILKQFMPCYLRLSFPLY